MNYTISAIETRYNGIQFRSRLEAKWAAMFDLLGWEWVYEPTDFKGWIPDFAIHGIRTIYVEVKPVDEFPHDAAAKMDRSGCYERMLIVGGRAPFQATVPHDMSADCEFMAEGLPYFGWCQHPEYSVWEPATFGRHGLDDHIGFMGTAYFLADYTKKRGSTNYTELPPGGGVSLREVELLWREASNRTRWNPRRRTKT
jgi:hypothetical protein